jgi:nicotinamide riboside transporter PnuC
MSANKYGFLLGGTNAAIYGIVYILSGAPFSAVSALLISFPLQIYSFFNWKKNSQGKTVALRWLPVHGKLIVLGITAALWAFCFFVLAKYNILPCKIPVLDTMIFTIGTVVTVLSSIRYIDSQYMNLVSCCCGLIMWIFLTVEDPATNISHAIIAVYNLYCVGLIAINWTLLYNKNKKNSSSFEKEEAKKL